MTRWVTTRETRLDILVAELMGTAAGGAVEAVLAVNPGLAALGPIVPEGRMIEVPEMPERTPSSPTRIWE